MTFALNCPSKSSFPVVQSHKRDVPSVKSIQKVFPSELNVSASILSFKLHMQ